MSFGDNCAVAYHLQHHDLRELAFPFDWILSPKLDLIIKLINSHFVDLFNLSDLECKNYSDNFPYLLEDNWIDTKSKIQRVNNKKYKVGFVHDFTSIDDLDLVIEKYNRRITRFYHIMLDPSVKKKIYRISPVNENKQLLIDCFHQNGFVNFEINFQRYQDLGVSIDWKFSNYDWKQLFLLENSKGICYKGDIL